MIYLINQAYQIVILILAVLMLLAVGFFAMYMASIRQKRNRKEEDMYFQSLNRKDAKDYLDFEDIVDDMVVTDHHRRFIAAIKCNGFDLRSASSTQIASTLQGYLSFINTIDSPITYRQYSVPMSMDATKSMYTARYEELERELFHKNEDRKDMLSHLNEIRGIDLIQEESIQTELEALQKQIQNLEWRRLHMKEQMDFMEYVFSEVTIHPSVEEAYLVEWEFNPNDYSIELSEEEIHEKAIEMLSNICNNKISILAGCNVSAYRCSTEELIEMFYQHTHPLSSSEFKMADVMNSGFFDEFVSSYDLNRKQETAYKDTMLEEGVALRERIAEAFAEGLAADDREVHANES